MARRKTGSAATAGKGAGERRRRRRAEPAAPSVAGRIPKPTAAEVETARRKFERGILERGEAVPKGRPLTPGATHEIVGKREGGRPLLKRRRFSTH